MTLLLWQSDGRPTTDEHFRSPPIRSRPAFYQLLPRSSVPSIPGTSSQTILNFIVLCRGLRPRASLLRPPLPTVLLVPFLFPPSVLLMMMATSPLPLDLRHLNHHPPVCLLSRSTFLPMTLPPPSLSPRSTFYPNLKPRVPLALVRKSSCPRPSTAKPPRPP